MFQVVRIFDFDGTLTKGPSFRETHIDVFPRDAIGATQAYRAGVDYAENKKLGIDSYFRHNLNDISCIATYHNNPNFIAGLVSTILGKELIFEQTELHKSIEIKIAVNRYRIAGSPDFFIAYIPHSGLPITPEGLGGPSFETVIKKLSGKNDHIAMLLKILSDNNSINQDTSIHFYDDSQEHFNKASSLPINAHLVDSKNHNFDIVQPQFTPFKPQTSLFFAEKSVNNERSSIEGNGPWLCNRGSRES